MCFRGRTARDSRRHAIRARNARLSYSRRTGRGLLAGRALAAQHTGSLSNGSSAVRLSVLIRYCPTLDGSLVRRHHGRNAAIQSHPFRVNQWYGKTADRTISTSAKG